MAQLLDNNSITYVSFPIVKVDKTDDGDLLVWGKATDGSVDHDQQIVDPEWSGKALETWLKTGGNVRVMHSAQHLPAGKGVEVAKGDGEDGHWVRSLVVEPTAKRLVEKGVLQAYSVGISSPKIVRDRLAKGGRIVGGDIHELSLVDRPANKNCGITLVKSAGGNAEDEPDADEADEDEDDVQKFEYDAARYNWMEREPGPAGDATSGTAFLAKRAAEDAWARWHAEGEEWGYHDPATGLTTFLAKRGPQAVDEGVDEPDEDADKSADEPRHQADLFETVSKGAKDCAKCGASFHGDSKLRKCEKCGAKLPKADKGFVPFKKKPDTSLDVDTDANEDKD